MRPQEIDPDVHAIFSMNADAQTANSSGFIMSLNADIDYIEYQHEYIGSTFPQCDTWLIRA